MSDEALRKHMALQQANQHNHKTPSASMEANTNPRVLSSIDEIFTRLKAIGSVGNAFKTPAEEAIVKQEWMLALREEGVVKQSMIDDGIDAFRVKARKSRGTAWFPSIGEFIDMCLGSNDTLQFAERAYNLFIKRESQIDTVGRMVTANHAFDLRKLEASKCKSGFVEYYLSYAQDNAIEPLGDFALTDGVKLSPEQEEAAQKRTATAQADFLAKFVGTADKMIEEEFKDVKPVKTGVTIGKPKSTYKTPEQLDAERTRQLDLIKSKLKG